MVGEDRISLLTDRLLLEIISRIKIMDKEKEEERLMSTKEVIKTTTTISKRWQHLWTRLPTLVFIDKDAIKKGGYSVNDLTNYFLFINKTLTQCPTNVNLKKFKLQIDKGKLDEDLIGKIFSESPCLETLELNDCYLAGRIPKSLFGNFGVLERLSCNTETYERLSYDDELFFDNSCPAISLKLSRCVLNPPNGAICRDTLTFLCIDSGKLDEDSIGKILSGSPCLETLQLNDCYGFRRIDVTSKSVKNLVLSGYGYRYPRADYYIHTLKINAPYILSLTIKGKMYLEELLLENVSSLVKADLNYLGSNHFSEEVLGRDRDDIEEELLRGLLSRLGHVNEITLGDYNCLQALSRLESTGFQFREGSDRRGRYPDSYRVFSLFKSDESVVDIFI